MIKQPNSDTSIRFSPLHIINQIREMNTNKINIYNPPGFCSVCFPYSSPLIVPLILRLSPQNFLHSLIYYLPRLLSPASSLLFLPLLFVLRSFEVALTSLKRNQHIVVPVYLVFTLMNHSCVECTEALGDGAWGGADCLLYGVTLPSLVWHDGHPMLLCQEASPSQAPPTLDILNNACQGGQWKNCHPSNFRKCPLKWHKTFSPKLFSMVSFRELFNYAQFDLWVLPKL